MVSISALIIARNEEKKIENTLKSIAFVDEIIIVLDRTTDNTQKIHKENLQREMDFRGKKKKFWN